MITSSRSGFLECDYNFHKSNSTYFSDFDIGRLELLVSLGTHGIEKMRKELAKDGDKAPFAIMLGGVSCNFRREIKPYQGFEVWTRVLAWDQKWIYVISHFVKKGVVKPRGYLLQPWRKVQQKGDHDGKKEGEIAIDAEAKKSGPHPAIFATGISKYVWKKGRLTIPPERVLRASELLPPKPADHETPPISMTPDIPATSSVDTPAASVAASLTPDNAGEMMAASLNAQGSPSSDEWTWDRVEEERKRGMKIAEMYNGLDMLNEIFKGDEETVLGEY